MAISVGSGLTSITGSVTATTTPVVATPSANQTIVRGTGASTGSVQTLYTVPAGKTFYLFGVSASNNVLTYPNFYLDDGSTAVATICTTTTSGFAAIASPIPIAVYTQNQAVKASAGSGVNLCVWGVII